MKWIERKIKTLGYIKFWITELESAKEILEMAKESELSPEQIKLLESDVNFCERMIGTETRIKDILDGVIAKQ